MRRILRKIKFNLYKIYVIVFTSIKTMTSKKRVALVSCDKWKYKVLEDIKLKYHLSKMNIKTDIISYEDSNLSNYDAVIIRSIWGFDIDKLNKWLELVNKREIKIFNSIEIIKNNYSKKNQFELLDKYNIKHIPTHYVEKENLCDSIDEFLNKYNKIVIKPHISESGLNTHVIPYNNSIKNSISKEEFLNKDINNDLYLIQPFYKEIKEGEISVVSIDKKISHSLIRYPGIFGKYTKPKETTLDKKLLEIVNKIIRIKEIENHLYFRIDFIKAGDEYLVLELELIDPMLFLNIKNTKKEIKETYYNFSKAIKERL